MKTFNFKTLGLALLALIVGAVCVFSNVPEGLSLATFGAYPIMKYKERNRSIIQAINASIPPGESIDSQQSFLRLDVPLANNSSEYIFDYRNNSNNALTAVVPQARLLDTKDAFICTALKLYIGIVDTSNYNVISNGWITYNNRNIFSVAALPGTTLGDLEVLYNTGQITFKAGNTDFVDHGFEVANFKSVPTTQGNGTTTQDSADYQGGGLVDCDQLIAINGDESMKFILNTVNINSIAWQSTSGTNKVYVSLRPQGVLVKGYGGRDGRYGDLLKIIRNVA